jgi:8-oxo-dGTP pyrophosphatase MutT (NUDIX family)
MLDPRNSVLTEWLRAYAPTEPAERTHAERMLDLLTAQQPFIRSHFRPGHFTASAFVLAPEGQSLLLIHHVRLSRWLQPGGHIEASDRDLLAAARRELSEEVGIDDAALEVPGIFDIDVHTIPSFRAEPAHEHFDVRFLFRAKTRALRVSSEAHAAQWVPLSELDARDSDGSVLRVAGKILGSAERT